MNRTLIAILFAAGCTATVRTAGPPPAEPMPPPPPPPHHEPAPPPPAPAPTPTPPPPVAGNHPAYIDAIHHLRYARALVERSGPGTAEVKMDEGAAIREIDAAMRLAHDAHIDDGRPLTEHPAIDSTKVYRTRLRQAVAELGNARHDLDLPEDNSWAATDRNEAKKHIDAALHLLEAAANAPHSEAEPPAGNPVPGTPAAAHPAYMTSLQNLRQARALLERPAGAVDVKWDEKVAIREIDDALHDIRAARVDDGKPETEHAPIESKLVYRDRLKEAEKQLHEAARDLESREDNFWAKKDRKHAIDSIRRAEKATHEAMNDRKDDKAEKREEKREDKAEKREEKAEKHAH